MGNPCVLTYARFESGLACLIKAHGTRQEDWLMPQEKHPFYMGRVRMIAYQKEAGGFYKEVAVKVFDHATNQGRLGARDFVHAHLLLGYRVATMPLGM